MEVSGAPGTKDLRPFSLVAGLLALLLFVAFLVGVGLTTRLVSAHSIHAVAPKLLPQKNRGVTLQREAFRHRDLLPLYGSSELARPSLYHGSQLFAGAPLGFSLFAVGNRGMPPLIMAASLAGVGRELRGRKVAVIISQNWVVQPEARREREAYAGNFSRLLVGELAFSPDLSVDLRRRAARRLSSYPETLQRDPLLRIALERLADGSPAGLAAYRALLPLGRLQNALLRRQDEARVLAMILANPAYRVRRPTRRVTFDWTALEREGEETQRLRSTSNVLGVDDTFWESFGTWIESRRNRLDDAEFLRNVERAERWEDLDILLDILGELGARPLLISLPLHGGFFDLSGVSPGARHVAYERLRGIARAHQVPLLDFEAYDDDPTFLRDIASHPSPKGWIHIDRALAAFYRDARR